MVCVITSKKGASKQMRARHTLYLIQVAGLSHGTRFIENLLECVLLVSSRAGGFTYCVPIGNSVWNVYESSQAL